MYLPGRPLQASQAHSVNITEAERGAGAEGIHQVTGDTQRQLMQQPSHQNAVGTAAIPSSRDLKWSQIPAFNISELYVPPDENVAADVVFVHGLMGHPVKTWLYGDLPKEEHVNKDKRRRFLPSLLNKKRASEANTPVSSSPEEKKYCYWPAELLPADCKNVRVMTYGYNSHPTNFYRGGTNRVTITQHAQDLRNRVARMRSKCRGRPLIFVAHSLGGILVKDAIIQALEMKSQPALEDVGKCCRHIFFFGTPHQGANIAKWGEIVSNIVGALPGGFSTYSGVLRGLEPDSEVLDNITRRFNALLDSSSPDRTKIASFQEGTGISGVTGLGNKVVPDYSSKYNNTAYEEAFIVQGANHLTMCEIASAGNATYQDFRSVLERYLDSITTQQQQASQHQAEIQAVGQREFLSVLNFNGRSTREHHLSSLYTERQSFDWVWSSDFVTWLSSDLRVFWIAGHPASGKSTLVNYLVSSDQTADTLNIAHETKFSIIHFFFDFRAGEGIRNNFLGLRRSLLHQILSQAPYIATAVEAELHLRHAPNHDWLDDERLLETILRQVLKNLKNRVLLFMDGLDEYQGEQLDFFRLIDDFVDAGVKLCLASRDDPPFNLRIANLASSQKLRLNEVNRPGIMEHARRTLSRCLTPTTEAERTTMQDLAQDVANRSNGVFLWADFAVKAVINANISGRNKVALEQKLAEVPEKLHNIYERIFKAKKGKDRFDCGLLLRLVTSARRDLLLSELFEATCLVGVHQRKLNSVVQDVDLQEFERLVRSLGGGVVELLPFVPNPDEYNEEITASGKEQRCEQSSRRSLFIKVIHRSVQTFLDEEGWSLLLGNDAIATCGNLLWLKTCAAFLTRPKMRWMHKANIPSDWSFNHYKEYAGRLRHVESSHLPTLQINLNEYVTRFLLQHAYYYERESGKSSRPMIREAMSQEFAYAHVQYYRYADIFTDCLCGDTLQRSFVSSSGLHLAIAHKLQYYVEEDVHENPNNPDLNAGRQSSIYKYYWSDGDFQETHKPGKSPSVLQTAVVCCKYDQSRERTDLVIFLAANCPKLNDEDMLFAIRTLPFEGVKALLARDCPIPLKLESQLIFHKHSRRREFQELESRNSFGPLWEVVCRRYEGDTANVLDFFLQRGEDINAQCGPLGTAIHSVIFNHEDKDYRRSHFDEEVQPMLNLLLSRGADINASGPKGNALEAFWAYANRSLRKKRKYWQVIHWLIDHGGVNQRKDPNGEIPTVERMLLFGTSTVSYEWDKYVYEHGEQSVPEQNATQYHQHLRGTYDKYVRPRIADGLIVGQIPQRPYHSTMDPDPHRYKDPFVEPDSDTDTDTSTGSSGLSVSGRLERAKWPQQTSTTECRAEALPRFSSSRPYPPHSSSSTVPSVPSSSSSPTRYKII